MARSSGPGRRRAGTSATPSPAGRCRGPWPRAWGHPPVCCPGCSGWGRHHPRPRLQRGHGPAAEERHRHLARVRWHSCRTEYGDPRLPRRHQLASRHRPHRGRHPRGPAWERPLPSRRATVVCGWSSPEFSRSPRSSTEAASWPPSRSEVAGRPTTRSAPPGPGAGTARSTLRRSRSVRRATDPGPRPSTLVADPGPGRCSRHKEDRGPRSCRGLPAVFGRTMVAAGPGSYLRSRRVTGASIARRSW